MMMMAWGWTCAARCRRPVHRAEPSWGTFEPERGRVHMACRSARSTGRSTPLDRPWAKPSEFVAWHAPAMNWRSWGSPSDYRDQLGFADSSHFSRSFKACYATSPKEFRDARVRVEQAGAAMQQTGPRVQAL